MKRVQACSRFGLSFYYNIRYVTFLEQGTRELYVDFTISDYVI